ncbi:MAG TPA: glycogen/starch synthase [Candidatus Limnocylindrales bacterium]|nr:glycogen/starch synthase [Candidatus Limnocylindrales bacterium]
MRIAMVTAECEPFAKTGGLADAVDGLARALGAGGHQVDVYLPRYGHDPLPAPVSARTRLPLAGTAVALLDVAAGGYRVRLVEHPPSFDRPGYYGDAHGDYPDNGARFTLLGRAVLAALDDEAAAGRPAEVLHGHDWQAAPTLLATLRRGRPATMLTCHNLAYHGLVPAARAGDLGLDDLPPGDIDLLALALERVALANTVSPTYARESLTPAYGAGLERILLARGDRYLGIVNGLDPRLWDPRSDADLAAPYGPHDLAGKAVDKQDLLRRHGLSSGTDEPSPLLGLVGRLDPQKGFDLLTAVAPRLLDVGLRIVVLGTGDPSLVAGLAALARARPDRLAVVERFDRAEARRIYAGVDAFLMPSRFEPCGQSQLIALRYGSPPIVRATGGLADTVLDADADPRQGLGFAFGPASPEDFLAAIERAVAAYRDPDRWAALIRRGMTTDTSWTGPAAAYEASYRRALAIHTAAAGEGYSSTTSSRHVAR